jgi:hypothetical protein
MSSFGVHFFTGQGDLKYLVDEVLTTVFRSAVGAVVCGKTRQGLTEAKREGLEWHSQYKAICVLQLECDIIC